MKRRTAFTLVELLVVIGIIAVLIGILLPALNRARQNAKRVECAAYLRQVGIGAIAYANDNHGKLPPKRLDDGSKTFSPAFTALYALDNKDGPPDTGSSIGRLVYKKYLTNPKIEYCPSASDQGDPSRSTYYFNPHQALFTAGLGQQVRQDWWKSIKNFGKAPRGAVTAHNFGSGADIPNYVFPNIKFALACDPMNGLEYATHAQGNSRAWNLLYIDGSVRTVSLDSRVNRDGANKWERMLDILGFLEQYAEGGQVNSARPTWNTYAIAPIDPR